MIRALKANDLNAVMKIWLDTNITAHNFIAPRYWKENYAIVKNLLPHAEVYVYEDDCSNKIPASQGLKRIILQGYSYRKMLNQWGQAKSYWTMLKEPERL